MSLEISFELGNGQQQINEFAESLMKVADNADSAKRQLKALFDLDYSGAKQFKDFVKEFKDLDTAATGLKGTFTEVVAEIKKVATASAEALDRMKNLNTEIVNNQKATNASIETLKKEQAQIEETANARKKGGSELVKYTENLDKQNQAFGKTLTQLLKYKDGWNEADDAQQKASQHSTTLAEAMGRVGKSINAPVTAMQKFKQAIADATLLQKEFANGGKETGITQEQYANSVNKAKKELTDSIAVLKLRDNASKAEVAAYGKAKTSLESYVNALAKFEGGLTKVAPSMEKMENSLEKFRQEENKAILDTKLLNEAMGRLGSSINSPVTAFGKFKQAVADADLASKKSGISAKEYANAIGSAKKELTESISALKLRDNASKEEVTAYGKAKTALDNYTKGVIDFKAELRKTAPTVKGLEAALAGLKEVQDRADQSSKLLNEAMGRLGSSINAPATAFKTFKQAVADASLASKEFISSEGKAGISAQEYANAIATAKKELSGSIATLKLRANASKDEINAYLNAKTSLDNYTKALLDFETGVTKVRPSVSGLVSSLVTLKETELQAADNSKKLAESMSLIAPLVAPQLTAYQKLERQLNALSLANKNYKPASLGKEQEGINPEEYVRGVNAATAAYDKLTLEMARNGTEALKHITSMKDQLAVMGKTSIELVRMKEGYKDLTVDQKLEAQQLDKNIQAMKDTEGLTRKVLTAQELYNKQVLDLTRTHQLYIRTKGEQGRSEEEVKRGMDAAREALNKSVAAEDKLRASLSKTNQVRDASYSQLKSYVDALQKEAAQLGKTEKEIIENGQAFDKQSATKKRQIRALQDYVEAMRAVAPMLQKQLTPLEQYNQGMERLNRLHAQFEPAAIGKPQVGISGAQYDIGSANLKRDLDAATLSKVQAAKAALTLGHNYGVVNQVTAAFRATLQGANLSFGMFTSSTILAATAAYAFSKAISSALTIGSQFEVEFERAAIVMGEFGSTLEGNLGTLQSGGKLIKSEILSLAEVTQYGTVEVAKAAATLAQAGLNTAEVYSALAPTLDLAAIAMVDVAEAADMAVGVMYGFGAGAEDLGRIVDVMAAMTVKTNLNLKQVAKTMQYAAPIAAHMGMSVEDLGAAISVLGNNAIKGSQAGTSLRSILIRTAAPTTAAGKAFKELGVSIEELTKNGSLDLNQLFTIMEKKGASARQMKDIFGQWAITSSYALRDSTKATDDGTRSWAAYQKEYAKVAGTSAEMAKALRMNLTGAVENLGSVIESIGTKAFDIFGQGLEDQIRRLSGTVSENSDKIAKSLGDLMATLTSFAVAAVEWSGTILKIGTTLTAFFVARAAVGSLIGLSGLLAASTELLALKSGAAAVANKGWASSISNVVSSFSGVILGSGAIVNAQAAQVASVDAVKKANENGAGAVAGFGKFVGKAAMLLSGWGGVALVIGTTIAPLLYDWFTKTEEVIVKNNVALENYAALTKDAKEGMSGLESVSTTQLEKLNLALEEGAKLQITNSEAASLAHAKAIQELDQQIAKLKELQEAQENSANKTNGPEGTNLPSLLPTVSFESIGKGYDYLTESLKSLGEATVEATSEAAYLVDTYVLGSGVIGSQAFEAKKLQDELDALAVAQNKAVESARLVREEAARTRANDIANMAVKGQLAAVTVLNTVRETAFKDALAKTSDKAAGAIQGYKDYIASLTGIQKASSLWVTALAKMRLASEWLSLPTFSFDKLLSQASAFNSFLEDKLGLKETDAQLSATIAENEAKAAQSIKDSQSALEAQIKTYQKATGSSAELSQKLKEVGESQAFIASGGKAAAETLAKLGLNAEQATVALEANKEALFLETAEQYLAGIDSRYKDFGDTLEVVTSKKTSAAEAMKLLIDLFKSAPGVTDEVAKSLATKFLPALSDVDTGAKDLRSRLKALKEEAAKFLAEVGDPKSTEGLRSLFKGLEDPETEFTLNILRFKEVFSGALEDVQTDSEKLEEAGKLFEYLSENVDKTTFSTERLNTLWERFQENSPIGQLKLSNQNLENQIALTLAGVDSLELYNAAWENTKGHLEKLDPEFVKLKQRSIELNKELERINQIRGVYQQFGDGLARMFADVFNGGIKSFKDFASKLKGMFTQMLSDLVYIYLKRNIFDKMTQGLMSMFSGGQGGGGIMGLVRSVGSAFGFGGSAAAGGLAGLGGAVGTFGAGPGILASSSPFLGTTGTLSTPFWASGASAASSGALSATGASAAATGGGLISGAGLSTTFAGVPVIGWIAAAVMANISLFQQGWRANGGSLTLPDGQSVSGGGMGLNAHTAPYKLVDSFLQRLGMSEGIASLLSGSSIATRLFGRKAPELTGATTTMSLSAEGGSGSTQYRTIERGGVFRSDRRRSHEGILSDEVKDAIQDLFNEIKQVMESSANQLKGEAPEMIDAAIRTVIEYDKKGKVKSTKYFVDLLGRTWEEETSEAATKRVIAEAMIATIDSILGTTVTAIRDGAAGATGTDGAGNSVEGSGDRSDAYFDMIKTVEAVQGEASAIAERWRDDAEKLYEGANFLLLAATDMRAGMGLLGEGSTLTSITDLIEELGLPTETLSDTYARVYMSANLLTDALDLSGITLDLNREAFVRFATDITTAAGGLEQAQGLWSSYFNTFYSETERLQLAVTRANTAADRNFDEIGLDYNNYTGTGGLAAFRAEFEAALPTLSATEIVQWLRAGESLGMLSTAVSDLDTAVLNSTQELRDLMAGVNEELGQFAGNSVAERIARVSLEINKLILEATRLGASPEQLATIESLEDARIQAILKEYDQLTAVYLNALDNVGSSTNLTGRALTDFVATMAEAAGGLEEASSLWSQFFEAFYPEGEFAVATSTANATSQFQGIGLNIGDYDGPGGMNSFRELFADRLPELSPEQIVIWLRAGLALDAMTDAIAALNEEAKEAFRTFMEGFKVDTTPGTGAELNSFEEVMNQSRVWIDFMISEGDRLSRAAGGEGLTAQQRAEIWQTGSNNVSEALQRLKDNFRSFVDQFKLDSTPVTGADAGSLEEARNQAQAWVNYMISEGDRLSVLATGEFMSAADRNVIFEAGARNVQSAMERLKQTFDSFMDQFKVDPTPQTGANANSLEEAQNQSMQWINYMISEADRLSQLATGTFATEEQRRLIWEAGARNVAAATQRLKEVFNSFMDGFKTDPVPQSGQNASSVAEARLQVFDWVQYMIAEGDRLAQDAEGRFLTAEERVQIWEAGAVRIAEAAARLRELFNNFLDGFKPDLTPESGENADSVQQAMEQSSAWVTYMIAEGDRLSMDANERAMTQAERDVIIAAGMRNVAAATLRLKEAFQSFMDGFKLDNTPDDGLNASSLFEAQQSVTAWVDYMIAEADRMSRDAGQGPLSTENREIIQAAGARNLAEATRRIAEELSSLMDGIDQEIAAFGSDEFAIQIAQVNSAMQDNIFNAMRLGATFTDLAKITQLAELQIAEVNRQKAEQLSNLMQGIEGELAELEGTTYIRKFQAISDTMNENIASATRLGASLSDLGRIQRLASLQVVSAIAELRESIEGLVTQLYGPDSQDQINATGSAQSSASTAEQEAIRETSELEQERYNAAQSAIKRIDEYLRGLMTSQLAPGSWQDRLGFAETDFQEIFDKAMSGDPEAMAQLSDAANTYLQLAQDAYGPGIDYTRIFDRVTSMLRRFQEYAATILPPAPVVTPDGGGGGGGSGGNGGSGSGSGMTEQERYRLALQLAGQIGALGLALDTSVFRLMREFGVDIKALAKDLGIDVGRFTAEMGINLGIMARSLNVGVGRLVDELGITREQLAVAFGVSITDFSEANIAAILEMGATLGISVFESMELLGVDLAALANSFGIDVANLNSGMGVKLVALADILGVSLTELTTSLGINLAGLATAFGVSTEAMNAGTLAGLQAMAAALGVSVASLIDDLDIGLGALATSFGVDLGAMSTEMFARFVTFAEIVGQDILSLASALGGDLTTLADQLVDSFSTNLETLPGVPDDIEEGLAPYLRAIRDADSSSGVVSAVGNLQTYINSLPQGVANSLNTLLASLGILPGTGPSQATLLAEFHASTLAVQGNIVTALGAEGSIVAASGTGTTAIITAIADTNRATNNILADILVQIQTSTTRIVNAINGVPEEPDNPPPNPLAQLSERDFSRRMDTALASRRNTEDSEVDEGKEEALQKALRTSAETAENLKKVERKLDDTLKVLSAKMAEQKEAQEVANAHLAKIAKKTSQLVEKDGA